MIKENKVSLWVGNVSSESTLEEYTVQKFTDDGDYIPSIFSDLFNLGEYDDDFKEICYFNESLSDIEQLLEGCSYDDIVIPKFKQLFGEQVECKINSVILLYNFEFDGLQKKYTNQHNEFIFIGAVDYR
ncbi:MAG: immunity 22 family protein [Spirochaetes bacterium]|nr:immunity 22 family protein [Spirochaetota bacterium]